MEDLSDSYANSQSSSDDQYYNQLAKDFNIDTGAVDVEVGPSSEEEELRREETESNDGPERSEENMSVGKENREADHRKEESAEDVELRREEIESDDGPERSEEEESIEKEHREAGHKKEESAEENPALSSVFVEVIYFHKLARALLDDLQKKICKLPGDSSRGTNMLESFILKLLTDMPSWVRMADVEDQEVVPKYTGKDSFSTFEFDQLEQCIKIIVYVDESKSEKFKGGWRVDEKTNVTHHLVAAEDAEQEHSPIDDRDMRSLRNWIPFIAKRNGFKRESGQKWLRFLEDQEARTVDDLKQWPSSAWSPDLSSDAGLSTTARSIISAELDKVKPMAPSSGVQTKQQRKKSPLVTDHRQKLSECMWRARVFRLTRFIYFKLGRIDELPLLDRNLLKDSIDAIPYDGEHVKSQVRSALEPYCVVKGVKQRAQLSQIQENLEILQSELETIGATLSDAMTKSSAGHSDAKKSSAEHSDARWSLPLSQLELKGDRNVQSSFGSDSSPSSSLKMGGTLSRQTWNDMFGEKYVLLDIGAPDGASLLHCLSYISIFLPSSNNVSSAKDLLPSSNNVSSAKDLLPSSNNVSSAKDLFTTLVEKLNNSGDFTNMVKEEGGGHRTFDSFNNYCDAAREGRISVAPYYLILAFARLYGRSICVFNAGNNGSKHLINFKPSDNRADHVICLAHHDDCCFSLVSIKDTQGLECLTVESIVKGHESTPSKINALAANVDALTEKIKKIKGVNGVDSDLLCKYEEAVFCLGACLHLCSSIDPSHQSIIDPPRGMILYGPPGTGKTYLIGEISKYCGFLLVCEPQTSGELNRPHVGETERVLKDIFERANAHPHLLCAVIIDEVESLVPRRKEGTADHKVSGISVFLGLIGGARSVDNLVLLLCTNRLQSIDEAILRRAKAQIFVGRPDPVARANWLARDLSHLHDDAKDQSEESIIAPNRYADLLKVPTANFTGSALKSLISDIATFVDVHGRVCSDTEILSMARTACRQFSIGLGRFTLPELEMQLQPKVREKLEHAAEAMLAQINDEKRAFDHSGKQQAVPHGLLFLALKSIDFQEADAVEIAEQKKAGKEDPKPPEPGFGLFALFDQKSLSLKLHGAAEHWSSVHEVLPLLTRFARIREIGTVFFLDLQSLYEGGSFDDNKMLEQLHERVSETKLYKRSMLIVDVDSVVGLNTSQSESSMGLSNSFSPSNQRLFQYVTNLASMSFVNLKSGSERWVVIISRHRYFIESLQNKVGWNMTDQERRLSEWQDRQAEREAEALECSTCQKLFYLKDNENSFNCQYHPAKMYTSDKTKKAKGYSNGFLTPKEVREQVPPEEVKNWRFLCCHKSIDDSGCKAVQHAKDGKSKNFKRSSYEAKRKQQLALTK